MRRRPRAPGPRGSRAAGWFLCGAAVLLAVAGAPRAGAYEQCQHTCGVPVQRVPLNSTRPGFPAAPTTIGFCGPITWTVCRTAPSFAAQDAAAEARYRALLNLSDSSTHEDCPAALRRAVCAEAFPACEIAKEIKRLCDGDCGEVAALCLPRAAPSALCPSTLVLPSGASCFKLDYAGPSVGLWLAGFIISVIFSFLAALGINLQKYSLRVHEQSRSGRPAFKQPYWLMGFMLIAMGSLLDFVAFGLAPQTFLAPLAALSLVWNMMLAPRFHRAERVTRRNIVATGVITFGVTSTVIFSAHATPTYQLDDLMFLADQPVTWMYAIAVVLSLSVMRWGAHRIEASGRTGSMLHIVCYGGLGGTFGGQSVLLAKCTVELVKSALFADGDAFQHVATYVLASSMAVTLLLQLHYLNAGLRRFDALLMVPTYQAFWIMASILGGMMFFEEYHEFTTKDWGMFLFGTAVTIAGIGVLLTEQRAKGDSPSAKASTRRQAAAGRARGPKYARVPDESSLGSGDFSGEVGAGVDSDGDGEFWAGDDPDEEAVAAALDGADDEEAGDDDDMNAGGRGDTGGTVNPLYVTGRARVRTNSGNGDRRLEMPAV